MAIELLTCLLTVLLGLGASAFIKDRKKSDFLLVITIIFIPSIVLSRFALAAVTRLRPERYDLYFNHIDALLGSPANLIANAVQHSQFLFWLAALDYGGWALPWFGAVFVILMLRGEDEARNAVVLSYVSGLLIIPLYLLFPATGPIYAVPNFPAPYTGPVYTVFETTRPCNCFPSGHFAGALLIAYFMRHWVAGRILGCVHIALTMLATLGLGEHYLVDLLASIAYVWCVIKVPEILERVRSRTSAVVATDPCATKCTSRQVRPH